MTSLRMFLTVVFLGSLFALGACNESDGPVHELESGIDHIGDEISDAVD